MNRKESEPMNGKTEEMRGMFLNLGYNMWSDVPVESGGNTKKEDLGILLPRLSQTAQIFGTDEDFKAQVEALCRRWHVLNRGVRRPRPLQMTEDGSPAPLSCEVLRRPSVV